MAKIELSLDDVLALLDRAIDEAGGVRAMARRIGVSPQYLSAIRMRDAPPSDRVLAAIEVKRIYVRR